LKRRYARILNWTLRHPYKIIGASAVMLLVAVLLFPFMGREFLPPFNEGALNINASLPPSASLQESNRIGSIIETALREVPEVVSTTRRTGRAELDEHAAGVNLSEIEVVTKEGDRPHSEMMEEVRQKLARIPGVTGEVGQPISHRIDHLLQAPAHRLQSNYSVPISRLCERRRERFERQWRLCLVLSIFLSNHRSVFHKCRST
jgi:HME family heavy-metal exporter